mgnify:CR=1 FL=1
MLERIMGMSTGVYILWGLGVLGVLLKFFANAYIRGMVRASGDLGDTKRKKLRNMCKKYENKKSFGLCGGDEEAYAESFVRGLRFLTRPMEFWNRSGTVLSLVVCGTMAGAYLYYDPSWRGSPDMQFFLANSILVCACLLVLDHILVINNKVEILKANIRGYLERIPKPREEPRARVEPFAIKKVAARTGKEDEAPKEPAEPSGEGTDDGKTASDPVPDKESAASEETLNRFLEQFFSG